LTAPGVFEQDQPRAWRRCGPQDYFEGWFEGDAARMERALHRDLVKRRSEEEL